MLMTSHSCRSITCRLYLFGISHHSYTAGPAAAAGCGEAAAAAEVESPAVLGPPFLNLIRGTCGLTVTNLRRTLRLAETEDIVDGSEVNFVKSAAAPLLLSSLIICYDCYVSCLVQ